MAMPLENSIPVLHPAQVEPLGDARERRMAARGDRLAVALYRALSTGRKADLQHVLAALVADQRSRGTTAEEAPASERVEHARGSLSLAIAALGRFPSRREYDRWRSEQPDPQSLASATFIRETFGNSWNEALAAAGAPAADISARRLLSNGRAFLSSERQRALELFAAAVPHGQRTRHNYEQWARAYVLEPEAFDVPLSSRSFVKHAGMGWLKLLVAAGLPDEEQARTRAAGRASRASCHEVGE